MKVLLFIFGIFLFTNGLNAQQTTQHTQYMFNKYQFNQAYAGFDRSLSITGMSRSQWATFEGAPTSQNINAHMPLYIWNGGIGIQLHNQKTGAFNQSSVSLSYNYVYESPIGLFSAAINVGILQSRLNGNELITPSGIYEGFTVQHNDALLPNTSINGFSPIWGVSAYYIHDYFETGISISDIPQHGTSIGGIDIDRQSLVNWFLEANYPLTNEIDLLPSVFVRTDFIQTQVDVAGIAEYRNQFYGGLGFRGFSANSIDAVIFYAGFKFNRKYRLTYSYDLGINGLRGFHEGTHEFVLNYNLQKIIGLGLPPKVIYNPRFL